MDEDGSADLKVDMDLTSVCEGGAPIRFQVLSTCSVKENKTFTLSDYAEEHLKNTLLVPYYDSITFHFVYPCASGHSYGDAWNKDATRHWRVCNVCGKTETVAEHTYDEGKVTTPATETEKGVKTYICTVCGQTKTESIPETGKKEEVTPGTGDAGGETPSEAPGTEIKDESGNGEYVVTTDPAAPGEGGDAVAPTVEYKAPTDASEKTITIPSTITVGGVTYQVTAIAENAFENNKNLTTVKIDSNVVTIGKNAFYGCKNLQKVTIGKNVTTIGAGAFDGCSKLKNLTIGKNVTTIGDKAFLKCAALTKVTIPAKVNKIGKQAFYGCDKLKTVIIKTTRLTSKNVAKNAFGKNARKVTVTLPKLAKNLEDGRFFYSGYHSASEIGQGFYHLTDDGTALVCEEFYFVRILDGDESDVTVYYNTTGSWDIEDSQKTDMSPEEFWALDCTGETLPITPFSMAGSRSSAASSSSQTAACRI